MTPNSLPAIDLLASREDLHRVWGRFDNQRPGDSGSQITIVVGAIACLLLGMMIWRIIARRPSRTFASDNPARLFRELCAAHRLNFTARRLLKRLAEARGMNNPALLFVEPQQFETQSLPPDLKSSANELRRLRAQLFES